MRNLKSNLVFILLSQLFCSSSIFAQAPSIAPEFFSSVRPSNAQTLTLCIWDRGTTRDIDYAFAQKIADALLLDLKIYSSPAYISGFNEEEFHQEIFINLADNCVGIMGMLLQPGVQIPDWLTTTIPYFSAPYVILADQEISNLADLPPGTTIASPAYTQLDMRVIALADARNQNAYLKRFPFDDPVQLVSLFQENLIDTALVWQPYVLNNPELSAVAPKYATPMDIGEDGLRSLTIMLRSSDAAMRIMLDDAIRTIAAEAAQ